MLINLSAWAFATAGTAEDNRLPGLSASRPPAAQPRRRLSYPLSHRVDHTDDYHGTRVADPYRWLEDSDSYATRQWVAAQNSLTFAWLRQLPQRESLHRRLTELSRYERYGLPYKKGGRYFFTIRDGRRNKNALYVSASRDGPPRLLLDPDTLSVDGTASIASWVPSEDGRLLAYGVSTAGSDWQQWHVLEVDTGRQRRDRLEWIKFSRVAWTPDSRGFYYSRYDAPSPDRRFTQKNRQHQLCYHRLGNLQDQDTLVYQCPANSEWFCSGEVTRDGRYLVIAATRGTESNKRVYCQDLQRPMAPVVELLAGRDANHEFVDSDGSRFWFVTDLDAPRRRVIAIDLEHPQRDSWQEVVAELPDTLEGASVLGGNFVLRYLQDGCSAVRICDLNGRHVRDLPLPGVGSVGGFVGRREDGESFFAFTSPTVPPSIYRYDLSTGRCTPFRVPAVVFDQRAFETRQVFCTSPDGTRVPLIVVCRYDLPLNGRNPTILTGYGGFGISQSPKFSASTIAWLEQGGVYAVAGLRGGGEYGRDWHQAGTLHRKQNVFDDFFAAAEWLIDSQYTSPAKLAISGGSNGGLLVGAALTQRPEMFAAAVSNVGVLDMLRYHKFTIGSAWVHEYGSSDDAQQFQTLLKYSPLHNLRPGVQYPATLITTADHDDRVVPAHSFKFAAALQAASGGAAPVLIRIESRAGHGNGTPSGKLIDSAADVLAFLSAILKVKPH